MKVIFNRARAAAQLSSYPQAMTHLDPRIRQQWHHRGEPKQSTRPADK
jgi:hypothetical protein